MRRNSGPSFNPRPSGEGHIFRFRGTPVGNFKKAFRTAVRRAGIAHCTPHAMRHTFATNLSMSGVDLPAIKKLMGHADIATTMRYAHPTPDHERQAVERLPQAVNPDRNISATRT